MDMPARLGAAWGFAAAGLMAIGKCLYMYMYMYMYVYVNMHILCISYMLKYVYVYVQYVQSRIISANFLIASNLVW